MIQNEDYGLSINSMVLCMYHKIVTMFFYGVFLEASFICAIITQGSITDV